MNTTESKKYDLYTPVKTIGWHAGHKATLMKCETAHPSSIFCIAYGGNSHYYPTEYEAVSAWRKRIRKREFLF